MIYLSFSFPHHGRYSSYHRLVAFRGENDVVFDASLPRGVSNPVLNPKERTAKAWRLFQEWRALNLARKGGYGWLHYLYPEHGCRLLHRREPGACRVAMSCHLPGWIVDSPGFRPGFKQALRSADALITVSPDIIPYYSSIAPEARIEFIPHGIDVDFFRPPAGGVCSGGDPHGSPVLLTVGNMMRDFDTLAAVINAAASQQRRLRFRVVANREKHAELKKCLTSAAQGLYEPHCGVDDSALLGLYHSSDLLFLPLTGATANNALLEAMACGLPILVSRHEACQAYAGTAARYFSSREPGDILLEIQSALDDGAWLRESAGCSRHLAETELAWPVIAERQQDFLRRATAPTA